MADLPLPLLASLLFTLIGPLQLIPTFARMTAGTDARLRLRIALVAFATAALALSLAVFAGASAMAKAGTTPPALMLAGGLILLVTALRAMFAPGSSQGPQATAAPRLDAGVHPIAVPGIVTPVGVAVIIIFVSYFPDLQDKLTILTVVGVILVLNLVAMLSAHIIMAVIGSAPLIVLGAVFGVLQAAMGMQMLLSGVRAAGLVRVAAGPGLM